MKRRMEKEKNKKSSGKNENGVFLRRFCFEILVRK